MGDSCYVWVEVENVKKSRRAAVLQALRNVLSFGSDTPTRRVAWGFYLGGSLADVMVRGEHELGGGSTTETRHAEVVQAVQEVAPDAKVETHWRMTGNDDDDYHYGGAEEENDG